MSVVADVEQLDSNHFLIGLADGTRATLYMDEILSVFYVGEIKVIQRQIEAHPFDPEMKEEFQCPT